MRVLANVYDHKKITIEGLAPQATCGDVMARVEAEEKVPQSKQHVFSGDVLLDPSTLLSSVMNCNVDELHLDVAVLESFPVRVQRPWAEEITLEVDHACTCGLLLQRIAEMDNMDAERMWLYFNGDRLEDHKATLAVCGVRWAVTLTVSVPKVLFLKFLTSRVREIPYNPGQRVWEIKELVGEEVCAD